MTQKTMENARVLFVNQADIFGTGSAGITIRSLFGSGVCRNGLVFYITGTKKMVVTQADQVLFETDNYLRHTKKLLQLVREYDPDVVYSTCSAVQALIFLLQLKYRCKVPVLMHYYDNWREMGKSRMLYRTTGVIVR